MSGRPDFAKTVGGIGCLMLLIPVVLVLGALFVAIAIAGGAEGVGIAVLLVGGVALLVARSRRRS